MDCSPEFTGLRLWSGWKDIYSKWLCSGTSGEESQRTRLVGMCHPQQLTQIHMDNSCLHGNGASSFIVRIKYFCFNGHNSVQH